MRLRATPQSAAGIAEQWTKRAGLRCPFPALKDGRFPDRPTGQTFRASDDVINLAFAEILYRARKIGEVDRLQRLDPKGHLVDDPAQTIARTNEAQQIRLVGLGCFSEFAGRGHPLYFRDI